LIALLNGNVQFVKVNGQIKDLKIDRED